MTIAIYLPLLLAMPLAFMARGIAARGAPGVAARGLTAVGLIVAISSTSSLVMITSTLLDDVWPLSALDHHSAWEPPEPVPGPVALVAGLILVCGAFRLLAVLRCRWQTHRQLRVIGVPRDGVVIADWSAPMAVAVPGHSHLLGWPGRAGHLLVTTGLLRLLTVDERRVVFAHEQAHLEHRHHRLVAAVAAAAAVNPVLIPVRHAVSYLVERWADEDAAAAIGDRHLAARAVARAALATVRSGPAAALGVNGSAAVHRVQALIAPAPAPYRRRLVGPVLLGAGCLTVVTVATVEFVALARAWL